MNNTTTQPKKKFIRELITDALPQVLPSNPEDAIGGKALLGKIRRLEVPELREVPERTFYYQFSTMCQNPAMPIAKHPTRQGYFLRPSGGLADYGEVVLAAHRLYTMLMQDGRSVDYWRSIADARDELGIALQVEDGAVGEEVEK